MTKVFDVLTDTIMSDLDARNQKGHETYGRQLTTFDGRDTGQDLYEELLDALVYTKKLQLELEQAKEDIHYLLPANWGKGSPVVRAIEGRWWTGRQGSPKKPKVTSLTFEREGANVVIRFAVDGRDETITCTPWYGVAEMERTLSEEIEAHADWDWSNFV